MSEIRKEKEAVVDEIKTKIKNAHSVVLVECKGLTVAQDTELRQNFRKEGVEYKVYKNRLAKIAFNDCGYTQFDNELEGPTAIAFGMKEAVAPARIVYEGIKNYNNKLDAKCGLMDGEFVDKEAVKVIASLPSKEVLLAKMLGSMLAPISKLACVLQAIADKEGSAAEAQA